MPSLLVTDCSVNKGKENIESFFEWLKKRFKRQLSFL
jgi:hypothetical protein